MPMFDMIEVCMEVSKNHPPQRQLPNVPSTLGASQMSQGKCGSVAQTVCVLPSICTAITSAAAASMRRRAH